MKQFIIQNKKNTWCWMFIFLVLILFIIIPFLSKDAGNTGDEDGFQIPQGRNVVNYFESNGADTTCMSFQNLKYYGSSFDVIAEYFNRTFHVDNIHVTRHIFNSFFGWLSIFIVGLIAYKIAGWRAGVITMLLLFFSPRYLGHSFNNPKDIPFAAAIITAIYGMILFFMQFPKVKWYTYIILVLSIAFSISVRIGGLILFGYFGIFGLLYLFKMSASNKRNLMQKGTKRINFLSYFSISAFFRLLITALLICVVGYFVGLLLWPYALQSPIKHPLESFNAMSKFAIALRQLFEGSLQWSDFLPWYYTPKYILMTIPVAVIVGLILFFVFCWRKKEDRFWSFVIFFAFFFPVFWIVYSKANVYGGWRHAMFAYPPMVVAAGLGFNALVQWVEQKVCPTNPVEEPQLAPELQPVAKSVVNPTSKPKAKHAKS